MTLLNETEEIAKSILEKAKSDAENFKSIHVEKNLPLQIDVGTLLAFDAEQIPLDKFKKNSNEFLLNLARDNTQILLNRVWELATTRVDEAIVAKLPPQGFRIPRELPLPKPKPPSKWERFAKEKGISKTKKSRLVWDEVLSKWVPRYGYRRQAAEKERDWCLEVPGNADPMEDQFAKRTALKTEKVAKNEFQRLRNIASSKKIKVPRAIAAPGSSEIRTSIALARVSTASAGKFQPELKNEKRRRNALSKKSIEPMMPRPAKKPFKNPRPDQEKKNNSQIMETVLNKRPKINIEKAVNRQLHQEESQRHAEKEIKKGKGKKKGKGVKSGRIGKQKKPAGGQGKRKGAAKSSGRKRR